MPTLCFDSKWSPMERSILQKTFRQNCRDIGITQHDASIYVQRCDLGAPQKIGGDVKETMGAICHIGGDKHILQLNVHNDIARCIFALGHEMVHFHQVVRGDLSSNQRTGDSFWKGRRYPYAVVCNMENYHDLPWEKEAHAKQYRLMNRAVAVLSPIEQGFCFPSHSYRGGVPDFERQAA